jgi:hypothetical protein
VRIGRDEYSKIFSEKSIKLENCRKSSSRKQTARKNEIVRLEILCGEEI